MEWKIIEASTFQTHQWSGGTTTQLFIFPEDASYRERNFQFRLSTATVEIEQSDFTSLPGFSRKLMLLSGSISLEHSGHYTKLLHKLEVDSFEGNWHTTSYGKGRDFNLMTALGWDGNLQGFDIIRDQLISYPIQKGFGWVFIYISKGSLEIEIQNEQILLNVGDLLIMKDPHMSNLSVKGFEASEWILAEISQDLEA